MIQPSVPRPARRRLAGIAAAGLLLAAVAGAPTGASAAPEEAIVEQAVTVDAVTAQLAVDEISSSDNMRLIANLPKQAPFDTTAALGTDIAFQGPFAYVGNYEGFTIYNIANPAAPKIMSTVHCPGSQNDISVHGGLLFLSTDSPRSDDSCASTGVPSSQTKWEGIKVFDISNPVKPEYIKSVQTACGSHTHTLVPSKDKESVYLYISSYGPSDTYVGCARPHDSISIVKVPVKSPTDAAVVAMPNLFPDGGYTNTQGCHDITVFPEKDLAAGACMGDGILMDISDREAPKVVHSVRDTVNFAFWHSATFNNTGTKVIFTDELGGGSQPRCQETTGMTKGADAVYDIVDGKLEFRSYYKIPRFNGVTENCVAHNGSLIPVPGRDIMVQAWYQGGISVWDFTDSANPKEIGYWERGPLHETQRILGGSWSAYYYNGHIYSSDIQKGFDVIEIDEESIPGAKTHHYTELNVQTQPSY